MGYGETAPEYEGRLLYGLGMKTTPLDHAFGLSKTPAIFAFHYMGRIVFMANGFDVNAVGAFIGMLEECRDAGGTVYFCGNGGKAALCSEFVNDLTLALPGNPFRAQSLMDNVAMLTAAANDYSYDQALARILGPMLRPEDLVVALSGSGNSENVINAVIRATRHGVKSVGIGRGGKLHAYVDLHIPIDAEDDGPTEDAIMMIIHMCQAWFYRQDLK